MKPGDVLEFVAYAARNVLIAGLALMAVTVAWCFLTHDSGRENVLLTMQYVGGIAVLIGCASVFGNTASGNLTAHQQVYMGLRFTRDHRDTDRSIAFSWLMMVSGGLLAGLGIYLRNI